MSFSAPTLLGLFTPNEARLLGDLKLAKFHRPVPNAPTGDREQDRLLFEFAIRPRLLAALTELLGADLILWGVTLKPLELSKSPPADFTAVGPGMVAVVPVGRPDGHLKLEITGGQAETRLVQAPVGTAILIPLDRSWKVTSASPGGLRTLVLRYAASHTALNDAATGKRLHAITIQGDDGRNCNWPMLTPVRGSRNAFAIPETYFALPTQTDEDTTPLVHGHTDVVNDLRVYLAASASITRPRLHEQLIVPLRTETGPWTFRPADMHAPAGTANSGPALVLEWIGVPHGYSPSPQYQSSDGLADFQASTLYLSHLSVKDLTLAADEDWSPGIGPADIFGFVTAGRLNVRGNEIAAPGLAMLPAGVAVETRAGASGATVRAISMRGPVVTLAPAPSPGAVAGPVVFCIPLVAKRLTKNWALACQLLNATLGSLYAQTDPKWRVLVVGNDPPDLTVSLDDRFEFIAATQDRSDGSLADAYGDAAFKRGLAEQRAREIGAAYIYFCDADDLISRDLVAFIRLNNHPYGYVTGRGAIWDAGNKLLAPLPLSTDILPLEEQTASSFAFNAISVPEIIGSPLNRSGHVRFRENMYRSGRPLMDVPFPSVAYVRFTNENMSDLYVRPSDDKDSAYDRMRTAIAEQALPLTTELIEHYGLGPLISPPIGPQTFGPKRISVLICTHRRPDGLERLLETLVPQLADHSDREIIVVNDGTHDERYSRVLTRFAGAIRYHVLPKSLGIAGARNRTAELARGEVLVFTDDDCEVPAHWLDWLDATLRANPELDVVAGTTKPLRPADANFVGKVQAHFELLPFPHSVGGLDQCFVTACLAVRSAVFRRVGGFNGGASYAIAGEDTELSIRLIRSGARTRVDPEWHVFHMLAISLAAEMRRFRRYGYANLQIAKMSNAPLSYRRLLGMRPRDLPRKFREHFTRNGPLVAEFSPNPLKRLASRIIASLIQTSYDRGAAHGSKR